MPRSSRPRLSVLEKSWIGPDRRPRPRVASTARPRAGDQFIIMMMRQTDGLSGYVRTCHQVGVYWTVFCTSNYSAHTFTGMSQGTCRPSHYYAGPVFGLTCPLCALIWVIPAPYTIAPDGRESEFLHVPSAPCASHVRPECGLTVRSNPDDAPQNTLSRARARPHLTSIGRVGGCSDHDEEEATPTTPGRVAKLWTQAKPGRRSVATAAQMEKAEVRTRKADVEREVEELRGQLKQAQGQVAEHRLQL